MRVVFDTNTLISALLFGGSLRWLVGHWGNPAVLPLASAATANEFMRVLSYPKFGLERSEMDLVAGRFLVHAVRVVVPIELVCARVRDPKDQMFVDLAVAGAADMLVTGDGDLLALVGKVPFRVCTPAEYGVMWSGA